MLFLDNNLRAAAGELWPPTLGDTLDADGDAAGDADGDMAQIGGQAAFDTCAGRHAIARAVDPRACFSRLLPALRTGGRAILVAENRRHHRALMRVLADIALRMRDRPSGAGDDRGRLLALLAHGRMRQMKPGLFAPEAIRQAAFDAGFATADIRPLNPDPTGVRTTQAWLAQTGATEDFIQTVAGLVASTGGRYLKLLGATDASGTMLVWLTKGEGATHPTPNMPPEPNMPPGPNISEEAPRHAGTGGMPARWAIDLLARNTAAGVQVSVGGWCLVNADVAEIAVTLDGVRRQTAVWHPRPDVDVTLNQSGLYLAWNALCCGLQDQLTFAGVRPLYGTMSLDVEIVLENGTILRPDPPETLTLDWPLLLSR